MNRRIATLVILVAGSALSSEHDDTPEPVDLSDDDKQELREAVAMLGTIQLIEGYKAEEGAVAERSFLESDHTEWWRCDDSTRFFVDDGCGEDGCPVTLAANPTMLLGKVIFAGSESYARYGVEGLQRRWDWCSQDDGGFDCAFVLRAGGDGVYYDFNAPSTTTNSDDGHRVARPAGQFKCERFSPRREATS